MYQVMGEHVLRKGFATENDALDHPVRLAHWKKIWVEESPPLEQPDTSSPPFPWAVEWIRGRAYVVDANGKKFATLFGTQARREHVATILYDLSETKCTK